MNHSSIDTAGLARLVQVTLCDGLLAWAIEQKERLRTDLEAFLRRFRRPGKRAHDRSKEKRM
jgi:hypothetical protein